MYVLIEFFSVILTCVTCLHIQYIGLSGKKDSYINDTDISKKSVNETFSWLYILKYEENDEQIESISDIPELTHVHISGIGQNILPVFSNVPKLKSIYMAGKHTIKTQYFLTIRKALV